MQLAERRGPFFYIFQNIIFLVIFLENYNNLHLLIDVLNAQIIIFLGFKCNMESLKHIKILICYNKFCPCIHGKSISFFLGHPVHLNLKGLCDYFIHFLSLTICYYPEQYVSVCNNLSLFVTFCRYFSQDRVNCKEFQDCKKV